MPNNQSTLTLHMHPLSSYSWKVLIALYETETPFQTVQSDGAPKDNKAYAELWPIAKMPLLQDGDRVDVAFTRRALDVVGPRRCAVAAQGLVVETGVDPVTSRFSGARSTN